MFSFLKPSLSPSNSSVCKCGAIVFFDNSVCLRCGSLLGYVGELGRVISFTRDSSTGVCTIEERSLKDRKFRCCAHRESALGCNWMVSADTSDTLCGSCSLTRTFPDIKFIGNDTKWSRAESAKRRVAAQLLRLGLPLVSRFRNPRGVCFDFLQNSPDGARVLTGHEDGVITLNVDEADDVARESMRQQMGEEYRTLMGHVRHELAHYYWDVLAEDKNWLQGFRKEFGDERTDYGNALANYYANGAPGSWNLSYISPYASSHPWEDWAETFAHHLHMHEGLHVAKSYGLNADGLNFSTDKFYVTLLQNREPKADAQAFIAEINDWVKVSLLNNEMARALGHHDNYPFVLNAPVVDKLWFIRQSFSRLRQALQAPPRNLTPPLANVSSNQGTGVAHGKAVNNPPVPLRDGVKQNSESANMFQVGTP